MIKKTKQKTVFVVVHRFVTAETAAFSIDAVFSTRKKAEAYITRAEAKYPPQTYSDPLVAGAYIIKERTFWG